MAQGRGCNLNLCPPATPSSIKRGTRRLKCLCVRLNLNNLISLALASIRCSILRFLPDYFSSFLPFFPVYLSPLTLFFFVDPWVTFDFLELRVELERTSENEGGGGEPGCCSSFNCTLKIAFL